MEPHFNAFQFQLPQFNFKQVWHTDQPLSSGESFCMVRVSSSKHSFWIRRIRLEDLVFTTAVRTKPSFTGMTFIMRPRSQLPLGKQGSTRSTKSPTWAFPLGLLHLWRSCNAGIYSFNHRLPKWLPRSVSVFISCTDSHPRLRRHQRLRFWSVFTSASDFGFRYWT